MKEPNKQNTSGKSTTVKQEPLQTDKKERSTQTAYKSEG